MQRILAVMDGVIESARVDKYPFARFSILFVAVGVMHCRWKYSNEVVVRTISYSKSFYNISSLDLINFLASTAGLRFKQR